MYDLGKEDNDLLNSRMFDEYSLADSQTLGTGYVVNVRDGSVSMITDEMVEQEDDGGSTNMDKGYSGWSLFGTFFTKSPTPSVRKLSRKHSSKKSNANPDEFEDNVNNLYGNADFYLNSQYNVSKRRQNNQRVFRDLSKQSHPQDQKTHPHKERPLSTPTSRQTEHNNKTTIGDHEFIVDFLKDRPSEMTWGRRIALRLMRYAWYYPRRKEKTEEDIIDEIIAEATKNKSGQAVLQAISHDENDKDHHLDDEKSEKHDIEQVEVFHNDPTTSTFIVPPSLEKAWAYFEHITLPRYVSEERKDTTLIESSANPKEREIAESGEKYFKTNLYHPFFTPINQLGEFGLGIALYFTTIRALMILLFVVGVLSIPNILYFSGTEYSNGQPGVFWALRGSAVCTEYEFVPCIDCTEDNFVNAIDRFRFITTSDGGNITFALKNNCDGATQRLILTNMATILVMIIGLSLISYFLSIQELKFDENVLSTQDYSIVVTNPPSNANNVEEWREYFTKKFDNNIHVSCCTIAVQNENLLRKLVKRREVLHQLKRAIPPGQSLSKENLEIITDNMKKERPCGSLFGAPSLFEKMLDLEENIKILLLDNKPVVSTFITFETESSQRNVLRVLQREARKGAAFNKKYAFRKGLGPLRVKEASEPSAVRWQDLSEPMPVIICSYVIPYILTFLLIIGSAVLIYNVRNGFWGFPASSTIAALIINIGNIIFPFISRGLTNLEVHRRVGQKQTSLYIKYALFRWVNTAVVTTLITPSTSTLMSGEIDTLTVVYKVFFFQILFTTLHFFDVVQNLKRHVFAPRAKTQEDMNTLMGGMELDIAERYSNMTTILFLVVWYCPLYPAVLFFGGVALIANLIADKFRLMRSWAPAPKLGRIVSKINRQIFFPLTSIIMILLACYTWSGFMYDNLCTMNQYDIGSEEFGNYFGSHTMVSFGNDEIVDVDVDTESIFYKYCDQSFWNYVLPIIPSLSRFKDVEWMTIEQQTFTEMLGWVGVTTTVIIIISVSYSLGYDFGGGRSSKSNEDIKKITFSASGSNAYIPEVQSDVIAFPLIACSVYEVANPQLFEWSSPYHPHAYYDLTMDALDIMQGNDLHIAEFAFSKVRYWEAPV